MLSLKRPDVFLFLRASAEGEEHSAKDQSRLCQLQALAPLAPACLASQVPLCLLTPRLRFFCSRTLPPDHLGALPSRRALCLKYLPYLSPFYLIISYSPLSTLLLPEPSLIAYTSSSSSDASLQSTLWCIYHYYKLLVEGSGKEGWGGKKTGRKTRLAAWRE